MSKRVRDGEKDERKTLKDKDEGTWERYLNIKMRKRYLKIKMRERYQHLKIKMKERYRYLKIKIRERYLKRNRVRVKRERGRERETDE